MKKYNYGISALLILMSIWILKEANTLGAAAAGTAMGSGVWPSFLAWAMIILSAALVVQTAIDSLKHKDREETEEEKKPIDFKSPGMKRIYILIGFFIIFAVLIQLFGFYISMLFLIPACLILLGEKRPKYIILITAGILVFVYLVFVQMLSLRLPTGSLMPW